jgi:hypothetical protein
VPVGIPNFYIGVRSLNYRSAVYNTIRYFTKIPNKFVCSKKLRRGNFMKQTFCRANHKIVV